MCPRNALFCLGFFVAGFAASVRAEWTFFPTPNAGDGFNILYAVVQ
jgi:hypothetical protein